MISLLILLLQISNRKKKLSTNYGVFFDVLKMNGYEFVDDVKRPLPKKKLELLCFGIVRTYLNTIRFNDIANLVLQYAQEEIIFPLFNEKFCSITHESDKSNNIIHCVFKRKNSNKANTLVMLVPFLSQIIKSHSNLPSINAKKQKTNNKTNINSKNSNILMTEDDDINHDNKARALSGRLIINFKMLNLITDDSHNLFQFGVIGLSKDLFKNNLLNGSMNINDDNHDQTFKDGLKNYFTKRDKGCDMDSILVGNLASDIGNEKSKAIIKSRIEQYYMSYSQHGKRYSLGGKHPVNGSGSCYINSTYELWSGGIYDDNDIDNGNGKDKDKDKGNYDTNGQYYWRSGDDCDLCIDYKWVREIGIWKDEYKLKGSMFWKKNGKLLKYQFKLPKSKFITDDNGNICLNFDNFYYAITFSNTTQEIDKNACVIDVTTSHQLLVDGSE